MKSVEKETEVKAEPSVNEEKKEEIVSEKEEVISNQQETLVNEDEKEKVFENGNLFENSTVSKSAPVEQTLQQNEPTING